MAEPRHESLRHEDQDISSEQILEDHISDKYGLGGDMSRYVRKPFAAVPKAAFSFAMAVMD